MPAAPPQGNPGQAGGASRSLPNTACQHYAADKFLRGIPPLGDPALFAGDLRLQSGCGKLHALRRSLQSLRPAVGMNVRDGDAAL